MKWFGKRDSAPSDDGPSDPSRRRALTMGAGIAALPLAAPLMVAPAASVSTPAAASIAAKTLFGTSALEGIAGLGATGGSSVLGLTPQIVATARTGKQIRDAFNMCQQLSGTVSDALGTHAANGGELAELGITPRDLFSPNIDAAVRASGDMVESRLELLNNARASLNQLGVADAPDWTSLKNEFTHRLAEHDDALRQLLPRCGEEEKRLIWNHLDPLHHERDQLAKLALEKKAKKASKAKISEEERLSRKPEDDPRHSARDEHPKSRMYWTVVQLSEFNEMPARFQLFSPYGEIPEDDAKRFVFELSNNKQRGAQTPCQHTGGGIIVHVNDPSAVTTLRAIASNNIGQSPEDRYGLAPSELTR